jgi:hypothetical protein
MIVYAKSKEIVLVLPAFCIGESYEAWVRRLKRRQAAHRLFTTEIKELSRSKPYQYTAQKLEGEINELLLNSREMEKRELDKTLDKILSNVEIVPIAQTVPTS